MNSWFLVMLEFLDYLYLRYSFINLSSLNWNILMRRRFTKKRIFAVSSLSLVKNRPVQLAELPRSEFDPELFPHIAYVDFFCDIRDKCAIFNILRQNMTNFDVGNG